MQINIRNLKYGVILVKSKKKQKKKPSSDLSPVALYELGMNQYLEKNEYVESLKNLKKAAKLGFKKAYGEIGIILYREKNDPEEAEKWFIKAEKKKSLDPPAAYEYGMLYYLEKGDWETALKYLKLSADQGYELAFGDIGAILYLETDKTDEAVAWFEKAVNADCILAPAAYYYSLLLMLEKNKWNESLIYLKKAAEEEFELAYGDFATVLYLEKNDIEEAEKWFKKAEKVNALTPPNAYQYGMLLILEKGDIKNGNFYLDMAAEGGLEIS